MTSFRRHVPAGNTVWTQSLHLFALQLLLSLVNFLGPEKYLEISVVWNNFDFDIPKINYVNRICPNVLNPLSAKKADDKIYVCEFSKHVKSKLYHIKNSKTGRQTVKI